jgi:hypothetical protein
MASVSQNGRRKPRPWTAQDQIIAEVAAACGVTCGVIGRSLRRSETSVREHLIPAVAKKNRESSRRWHQTNTEKVREYRRNWHKLNAEKACERSRQWRKDNPERLREQVRKWRKANPVNVRMNTRRYRQSNPGKNQENLRRRATWRRAARRAALHPVTRAQIDARFAIWDNRCAFCGVDASHERNHGRERLTVEHVLALTKGGLDEASNIIPACSACNSSKNNSPVEDWYRQQPWFTEARWRKIQRHCPAAVVGQLPLALAA